MLVNISLTRHLSASLRGETLGAPQCRENAVKCVYFNLCDLRTEPSSVHHEDNKLKLFHSELCDKMSRKEKSSSPHQLLVKQTINPAYQIRWNFINPSGKLGFSPLNEGRPAASHAADERVVCSHC